MSLTFDSMEEAIAYAVKNGMKLYSECVSGRYAALFLQVGTTN